MSKLKLLDLFSGIGGFSYGLELTGGFETIAFCEMDPYCQAVLKKHWPHVPIHSDVKKLKGDFDANVITGGWPCQPVSKSGKREGEDDDRYLWPEMRRVVESISKNNAEKGEATWLIGENVYDHISLGFDTVLADLEALDFTVWVFVIPAAAVGARHRRDRLWVVAHTDPRLCARRLADQPGQTEAGRSEGGDTGEGNSHRQRIRPESGAGSQDATDGEGIGLQGRGDRRRDNSEEDGKQSRGGSRRGTETLGDSFERLARRLEGIRSPNLTAEPLLCRKPNGLSPELDRLTAKLERNLRMNRLRSIGNSIQPQIVQIIGHIILEFINAKTREGEPL